MSFIYKWRTKFLEPYQDNSKIFDGFFAVTITKNFVKLYPQFLWCWLMDRTEKWTQIQNFPRGGNTTTAQQAIYYKLHVVVLKSKILSKICCFTSSMLVSLSCWASDSVMSVQPSAHRNHVTFVDNRHSIRGVAWNFWGGIKVSRKV